MRGRRRDPRARSGGGCRPGDALRAWLRSGRWPSSWAWTPSPELCELHRAGAAPGGAERPAPAVRELPARISSFVGRDDDLTRAAAVLADQRVAR